MFNLTNLSISDLSGEVADYDIISQYCKDLPIFLLDTLMKFFIVFLFIDLILIHTKYYERAIKVYYKAQWFMFVYVVYYWVSYNNSGVLETISRFSSLIYLTIFILSAIGIYKNREELKRIGKKWKILK
jgi:hypothetical protein